jgi:hypothetical protein
MFFLKLSGAKSKGGQSSDSITPSAELAACEFVLR